MSTVVPNLKRATLRVIGLDRVVVAFCVSLLALAIVDLPQVSTSLRFTADALFDIAPFLAVSVAFAASSKATGLDRQIARIFSQRGDAAVLLAAAFGALSPFCSCGVIPIIAGLLGAGVPLGPVMAFWLASPLMDPEMFILMLPVFPLEFILAKALAAFAIGVAGGFAVQSVAGNKAFLSPLKRRPSGCASDVMRDGPLVWAFWQSRARRQMFLSEVGDTGWFLFKWLALAFLAESLMLTYLPADALVVLVEGSGIWTVPVAAAIGVPAYMNGYAAIPMVSALIEMGLPAAAGMAFMLAGGVTSIPAAMSVFALVRWPVFLAYLVLGGSGAVAAGLIYRVAIGA